MKTKHTPGPWEIEPHSTIDKEFNVGPGISVDYDDVDHAEQDANAKLIAAAPDLLEALNYCISVFDAQLDQKEPYYIQAVKAIKRATE